MYLLRKTVNNFVILLMIFLLNGCALSQWAFRNASDRIVAYSKKVEKVSKVFATKKYLVIRLDVSYSADVNPPHKSLLCIDIVKLTRDVKKIDIFVNDPAYGCPDNIEEQEMVGLKYIKEMNVHYENNTQKINSIKTLDLYLFSAPSNKKKLEGNKLYYGFVPITFVLDIVTSPIQLGYYFYKVREDNLRKKNKMKK
jgi:hypothetical protein